MNKISKKDYRGQKTSNIMDAIQDATPAYCYKTANGEKVVVLLDYWAVQGDVDYFFWQYKQVTYLLKRGSRPRVVVTTELFTSTNQPSDILSNMRRGAHWERYNVREAIAALDYIG